MVPTMTTAQWVMMLMLVLVQSSMGMLLSLFSVWSYRVKLIFIIGQTEHSFFYWFAVTSLLTNLFIFSSMIRMMTNLCSEMTGRGAVDEESRRNTSGSGRTEFGAFGYQTI